MADYSKKNAGEKAAEYIENGMVVGLGSGSTVYWMMKLLSNKIKQGLKMNGVPSSKRTENWAKEFGIPLCDPSSVKTLDLVVDGADEIDPHFNLLKGGGGSLVREKIVMAGAEKVIIIGDQSKMVETLGARALPVEVLPFGLSMTMKRLQILGCTTEVRKKDGQTFVSDNGNVIVDCKFGRMTEPESIHFKIKQLIGVVETGIFTNMADVVLIGGEKGVEVLSRRI
ncbi:ribose 5-phosphate isomerase [Halobacillus sp. BBL2006]|nr:ribose 5-phosphate isomerase [Halobacillus sp. BBL2006]